MDDIHKSTVHRPGDLLLNRYLPDADEETRELAREKFRELALFLLRSADRLAREEMAREKSSNNEYVVTCKEKNHPQTEDYFGA